MNKFIRKNQKMMMAFFGVILMIAFLLQPGGRNTGPTGNDKIAGSIGDEKLSVRDFSEAHTEWLRLMQPIMDPESYYQQTTVSLKILGRAAVQQIQRDPNTFLLLQREAQRSGVRVTEDAVNSVLANLLQITPSDPRADDYRKAITDCWMVKGLLNRVDSAVKISKPIVQYQMAKTNQEMSLKIVEFSVSDYIPDLAATTQAALGTTLPTTLPASLPTTLMAAIPLPTSQPTTTEIVSQYDKFNDVEPDHPDGTRDPLGFGYKYPNRVKYQYIGVDHAGTKTVLQASKSDVQWRADAYRYIRNHPDDFPREAATAPTTSATTAALAAATAPASTQATGPTTRQVQTAYDQVLNDAVDKRIAEIIARINSTLSTDFNGYRASLLPGAITTQPVTSFGVPYASEDYLRQLALSIQQEFGVLPTIGFLTDNWRTAKELTEQPGIGKSNIPSENYTSPPLEFSTYATQYVKDFLPEEQKGNAAALALYQPSQPLQDAIGGKYIFRVTAADKAHPAPQNVMEAQIRQDLKIAAAYDAAHEAAKALLAKINDVGGFQTVADTAHLKVITTGLFHIDQQFTSIPGYVCKDLSAEILATEAMKLLESDPATGQRPKAAVISLYPDRRWVVITLDQVHPLWTAETQNDMAARVTAQSQQELQSQLELRWCDPAAVAQRLNYKPDASAAKNPTQG